VQPFQAYVNGVAINFRFPPVDGDENGGSSHGEKKERFNREVDLHVVTRDITRYSDPQRGDQVWIFVDFSAQPGVSFVQVRIEPIRELGRKMLMAEGSRYKRNATVSPWFERLLKIVKVQQEGPLALFMFKIDQYVMFDVWCVGFTTDCGIFFLRCGLKSEAVDILKLMRVAFENQEVIEVGLLLVSVF